MQSAGAQLYSNDILQSEQSRDLVNFRGTVSDLLAHAPSDVQLKLRSVDVAMPLLSLEAPDFPLGVFSLSQSAKIVVPVQSKKFFSDLLILWSWFDFHGCNQNNLASYLAIVMTRRSEARALGGPLEAFNLPEGRAVTDTRVDKASLEYLNTGMNFILAHELGHIYYGDGVANTLASPIEREERADGFAMNLLALAHIRPFGVIQFFTATRFNDPALEVAPFGTHPLSQSRLSAIANRLRQDPKQFLSPVLPPEKVAFELRRTLNLANDIDKIAAALAHEDFIQKHRELIELYPPSKFRLSCY